MVQVRGQRSDGSGPCFYLSFSSVIFILFLLDLEEIIANVATVPGPSKLLEGFFFS